MNALLLLALASLATAQDTASPDTAAPPPIVSGTQVPAATYDDAVAILVGGEYACTGTLVGPKTVVTSALCAPDASHVIVGSKDWASSQGELLPVESFTMHPLFNNGGLDIAVIKLTRASQFEPRAIAAGCALDDVIEGATVTFAGFGALRADEVNPNTRLNSVQGTIVNLGCVEADGCDEGAPQGSEFIAGAEGVGPCIGDDGSPVYLNTPNGEVLLGFSSRKTATASQDCGDPSIFTRADAYKNWIEDTAEDELAFPICDGTPLLNIQPFDPVSSGGVGRTSFTVTDTDQDSGFTFLFSELPSHGTVDILQGNILRYRADRDYTGPDSFTLKVEDSDRNESVAGVEIEVVRKGVLGCGCSSALPAQGHAFLWLGAMAFVRLRRRPL